MKKKLLTMLLAPALTIGSLILPNLDQAMAATTGEVVASVSFRTSPDTNSDRIRYLKDGESLTILEKVNAWWYKVKDRNGRIGYVSSDTKYVKAAQSSSDMKASTGTAKIVSSVSFRKQANENASRIRYLKAGEAVTILEVVNDWWFKVKDSNGQTGYVSSNSKYIQRSAESSSGSSGPVVSVSEKAKRVIEAGRKYLGTPYEFASSRYNTKTFDCSDFVRQAFLDGLGQKLPSDSRGQGDHVKSLDNDTTKWKELKPGDLMFFMEYRGSSSSEYKGVNKSKQRITHVSIYLGDGKMLHTYSKDSGGVRIDSFEKGSWEDRFMFGGSAFR
jgi:cell wall-associated NlpC family hydrolase